MKTKNVAVSALAGVLVLALWYTFYLKPTRSQASKVKADTANERTKLAPLQEQLAQAQRDASHAAQFKAELASLQLAMPDSPALAAFIRDANDIAQAAGVTWQSVTHAPPTPGTDGVMSIAVGIQIKGSYPQAMDYLGRLAALKRLVVVDSVAFNAGGSTGAGGNAPAGGSTGPFTGSDQLIVTISARMFETPPAAAVVGTETASGASAPSAPVSASTGGSTLNNS